MKLSRVIAEMIEYEVCEINKNQFLKVLKCTSDSKTNQQIPLKDKFKRRPVIVIIPGIFIYIYIYVFLFCFTLSLFILIEISLVTKRQPRCH